MPSVSEKRDYEFRSALKLCATCGASIKLKNTRDLQRKRFCSPSCKHKSLEGKRAVPPFREARKCVKCGLDYIASAKKQQYCSGRCNSVDTAKRSRARHNDLPDHIKRLLIYKGRKDLSVDYVLSLYEKQNGLCSLSGIKMTWDTLNGRVPTNLSIDRISSYIGYTKENVQLVCRIVNVMKSNLGQLEFIDLCRKIGGYSNS